MSTTRRIFLCIFFVVIIAISASGCVNKPILSLAESQCSIIVDCSSVVSAEGEKSDIVPDSGIIFSNDAACFSEGESVFEIVKRELKENKIHFEISENPVYIKGIGNIYEGDFSELSGWVYTVNGESPMVSCAEYFPKNSDVIKFEFITSWE